MAVIGGGGDWGVLETSRLHSAHHKHFIWLCQGSMLKPVLQGWDVHKTMINFHLNHDTVCKLYIGVGVRLWMLSRLLAHVLPRLNYKIHRSFAAISHFDIITNSWSLSIMEYALMFFHANDLSKPAILWYKTNIEISNKNIQLSCFFLLTGQSD